MHSGVLLLAGAASVLLPLHGRAQERSSSGVEVRVDYSASDELVASWRDWKRRGPENGGFCVMGRTLRGSGPPRIFIRLVSRVARLEACGGPGDVGAGIFVPGELFSAAALDELSCALLRERSDWLLFGVAYGTRRRLLPSGTTRTEIRARWCVTSVEDLRAGIDLDTDPRDDPR